MFRKIEVSRTGRVVVLFLASALLVSLLINVGDTIRQYFQIRDLQARYPYLSLDFPQRSVAALHFLAIPVFLAIVFARKYVISGLLTLLFSVLVVFGMYLELDGTGALGGEGFYTDVWIEFWAKTDWIEWVASISLGCLLLWHIWFFARQFRRVEIPTTLP